MSKNRMINTKFWPDTYISNLNPLGKLLFLYLITNQYTNICGIYEISIKQMALDTAIPVGEIENNLLPKFRDNGKIYYIDGWVYIKNFLKHQKASGNVRLGVENGLRDVPQEIMAKIKEISDTPPSQVEHSLKLKLESELELKDKICEQSSRNPFKKSLKEKYKNKEPMTCDEFVKLCRSSSNRHIQIIAEWAEGEKPNYKTKGEWARFLNRNLRPARELTPFTNEQLQKGYEKMLKDVVKINPHTGKKDGFISKYTLETLNKYL